MNWSDLTANCELWFPRIQSRFPYLEDSAKRYLRSDRARFEAHLARTHNLSLNEAREEIEDFLFVETLMLEAASHEK